MRQKRIVRWPLGCACLCDAKHNIRGGRARRTSSGRTAVRDGEPVCSYEDRAVNSEMRRAVFKVKVLKKYIGSI